MNNRQLQESFELQATAQYGAMVDKPTSKEIEMWLNIGKDIFYKTRYSGVNFKGLSYEEDQKRIEDLRRLKETHTLPKLQSAQEDVYSFQLPNDYFITTGESANIVPTTDASKKCWRAYVLDDNGEKIYLSRRVQVMECTDDNIDEKLSNRLSDHIFQGSTTKPLRVHQSSKIDVYTDGNYEVISFTITYLRIPTLIDLHTNPLDTYNDFPETVHGEIVNLAVKAFLENKGNQRYQTYTNEVTTAE